MYDILHPLAFIIGKGKSNCIGHILIAEVSNNLQLRPNAHEATVLGQELLNSCSLFCDLGSV